MLEILSIHSNVSGDANLTDGHAWLSMHFTNGKQTTIGLWTTTLLETRRFLKDPTGVFIEASYDINLGLEAIRKYEAKASRFYKLDETQSKRAISIMSSDHSWRFTNTCASWARRVVKELVGEDIDASELAGIVDTPRTLGQAILRLEAKYPTSLNRPKRAGSNAIAMASIRREKVA